MKDNKLIPFIKPDFPPSDQIKDDLEKIIENNYYTNSGPFEKKFEQECAKYIGSDVEVSMVSSASMGLMLSIQALLGCGDEGSNSREILIASFTFTAGVEAIMWNNFRPVFIDVGLENLQPSIVQTQEYLKNNDTVAGILLTNTYGIGTEDIAQWESLAKQYNVPLIIDSAAGFGSRYQDSSILGSRGDCEVFSLHATKTFAVGEGGLVATRNKKLHARLQQLKNFGFNSDLDTAALGFNAKAPEISSAIGLRQLERLDSQIAIKHRLALEYQGALDGTGIEFVKGFNQSSMSFLPVIMPSQSLKTKALQLYYDAQVQVRDYYTPLHQHSLYSNEKRLSLDNTKDISSKIIALPLYEGINILEVSSIMRALSL